SARRIPASYRGSCPAARPGAWDNARRNLRTTFADGSDDARRKLRTSACRGLQAIRELRTMRAEGFGQCAPEVSDNARRDGFPFRIGPAEQPRNRNPNAGDPMAAIVRKHADKSCSLCDGFELRGHGTARRRGATWPLA